MKIYKDQILGGTAKDSQNEKLSLEILEGFAETYRGKRHPLNQSHDLAKKSAGYIENIRVIDHPIYEGEYALVGDVFCDESKLEEVMGGFSVSYLEVIRRNESAHEIITYLPYPHYNDLELLQFLSKQNQPISVGKWVKKAADPATVALIGAAIIFVLQPVWDDLYKTKFAPKIRKFFQSCGQKLKEKEISCDLAQTVEINGHQIQVLLIPDRRKEDLCFSSNYLEQSMQLVHKFAMNHSDSYQIARIHLYFHSESEGYKIHRVEDAQGTIEHYA